MAAFRDIGIAASSGAVVLAASTDKADNRKICQRCGKPGHTAPDCWNLQMLSTTEGAAKNVERRTTAQQGLPEGATERHQRQKEICQPSIAYVTELDASQHNAIARKMTGLPAAVDRNQVRW